MAIGVTLAGSVKKGMSREVSFVVFLGPIMVRTTSLGWVMEGIIPGGILVTRIFFSCPKYSVALKTGSLFRIFSYISLSSEYCRGLNEV